MRYTFCFVTVLAIISACSDNRAGADRKNGYTPELKNRQDSLFHEIMKGHDESMAKMGKLTSYHKRVEQAIDSLSKVQGPSIKDRISSLKIVAANLQDAENAMNKWMEEFGVDSASDNDARRIEYLESEKQKVNKVKDDMLSSLAKTDSLLSGK